MVSKESRQNVTTKHDPDQVGLPPRLFLYTLDQVAAILQVQVRTLETGGYVFFHGRSIGVMRRDMAVARNIAPSDQAPEWRIAERELVRFLKVKGFQYYEAGYITS